MKTSSRVYLNKEFGLLSALWCSPACPTRRKDWSSGLGQTPMLWLLPLGIALGHLPTLLEVQEDTDG